MVSTSPSTPRCKVGHRRSRSQSSTASPSPPSHRDDHRSRAKRAHTIYMSHSDPVDLGSCMSYSPQSRYELSSHPIAEFTSYSHKRRRRRRGRSTSNTIKTLHSVRPSTPRNISRTAQDVATQLAVSAPNTPMILPCTPKDFNLSYTQTIPYTPMPPRHLSSPPSGTRSSHSEALGDLHRSLDDGEQRFVSRMREWEEQQAHKKCGIRGRPPVIPSLPQRSPESLELEDDDVDIVLNHDPVVTLIPTNPACLDDPKTRMLLSDSMDEDEQYSPVISKETDPFDSSDEDAAELVSSFTSVSEDNSPLHSARALSLSFTTSSLISLSGSSNSSIVSLAIPPPTLPLQTRTDKAVAALALAIANGAVGLHDYQDILDDRSYLEHCEAGALWH